MKASVIPMVVVVTLSPALLGHVLQRAPGGECAPAPGSHTQPPSPTIVQELQYRVTVSGLGYLKGHVLKEDIPDYPAWARTEAIEGTVVVDVMTSTRGRVTKAKARSGPVRLRPVAERAARQWVFRPTGFAPGPVRVKFSMTFTFSKTVTPAGAAQLAHAAERAQRDRSVFP